MPFGVAYGDQDEDSVREAPGWRAGADVPIAAVDVETTGLHPAYHHRVLEIAVVCVGADGERSEWSTLVNPGRDLGPQSIHGIRGIDLLDAPTFADVAGDLMSRLDHHAIVAHNAAFDRLFIEAELRRAGVEPPDVAWCCTMDIGTRLGWGASLAACCGHIGVRNHQPHCALDDARACVEVLLHARGVADGVSQLAAGAWPSAEVSGRARERGAGALRPAPSPMALMARAASEDRSDPYPAYSQLLADAMEDRVITEAERGALAALSETLGLSPAARREANTRWLGRLLALAQSDGTVTQREQGDLVLAADVLEVDLEDVLSVAASTQAERLPAGTTVCFTGALECTHRGAGLTRERARALAEGAGLLVVPGVTKKCDVLVLADPHSQSGKAKKARGFGVRLIAESAFWPMIGVDVQ